MNIKNNINGINSIEKIMENILVEDDFNKMNGLINNGKGNINSEFLFPHTQIVKNAGFISVRKEALKPYIKVMTEEEFYEIVGATSNELSKQSGRYQEYLYGHYLEALELNDEGYIADVLKSAAEFKKNISYIKSLMNDKSFVTEWRKDFGSKSAIEIFISKGDMKIVNIVKERAT